MPKTVTIKLLDPFPGHGGQVTEVVVRAPRGRDFFELGDPVVYGRGENKIMIHAENSETVRAYIERCIEKPDSLLVMSLVSLEDSMQIKDAVLSFFMGARQAISVNAVNS